MRTHKARFIVVLAIIVVLAASPHSAGASYSWGNYHWARTSNPATTGTSMLMWVDAPHFYKSGRIIVLYVGSNATVLRLLEAAFGKQFAGR